MHSRTPEAFLGCPALEPLEPRLLLSVDLAGFDARPYGFPNYYYNITETSAYWGQTINGQFDIVNWGDTTTTTKMSVALYASQNSVINDAGDVRLTKFTNLSVPNPSSFASYNYSVSLPALNPFGSSGTVYIGMVVDCDNNISESNEGNNSNVGDGTDRDTLTISDNIRITDSVAPVDDRAINFGSVVDDGHGNASTTQTFSIVNLGPNSLQIAQNGLAFVNGTHFRLGNIISNKDSSFVNLTTGPNVIDASSAETWSVEVIFDPSGATGTISDSLRIISTDTRAGTPTISLTGTSTPVASLGVSDSTGDTTDRLINFGDVAVDGSGGVFATANVTLKNPGSGPLTIFQNGVSLPSGPFSVTGIISSTQGAIDLSGGSASLAGRNGETWTVSLRFDPTTTGLFQSPLTIQSRDPNASPSVTKSDVVSLIGTGKTAQSLLLVDSVPPPNDKAINFGSVHADGAGLQVSTQTVTLSNGGNLPLTVNQNGIYLLSGTQFKIASITSSKQGAINLASGAATMAGDNQDTWTVVLQFDPTVAGASSDTLGISTNDPVYPTSNVSLSGTGLDQPDLVVTDSDSVPNDLSQSFGATLNDGAGGRTAIRTVQLSNIGNQPLTVSQNGIFVLGGTAFQVTGIVSSVSGSVDLSAGSATIAARSAETWTVTLQFDPTVTAPASDTLRILSDSPGESTVNVALSGEGVVPTISLTSPTQAVHVSANQPHQLVWTDAYSGGNATILLYYDTDTNPAVGLVPIITGLLEDSARNYYDWFVPAGLVGGTYTIYAMIADGGVSAGSYASGSLTVDAANTDRLLSAPVTADASYTLRYGYNGAEYTGTYVLSMGDNALYNTIGAVTHEYHITRVPTLTDSDHTAYDELGAVTAVTDSAGQAVSYTYDQLKRLTQVTHPDGSTVDYTYDVAGNLLTMHDATGWQLYTYDALDRLTSVTYSADNHAGDAGDLTIGYEYDLASRLTALVYPSGKRVEYGYDNAGKLTTVTEKNAGQPNLVTTYVYSATTGLLMTENRPNDTRTQYTYDTSGRLTTIRHERTSTSALILQYDYTLDAAGRRTQVVVSTPEGTRAENYEYDDLNRLAKVTYSDEDGVIETTDKTVAYIYDLNGNRLSMTTDEDGSGPASAAVLNYIYGPENRLEHITDGNGNPAADYYYDWRGNQVMKVTPTQTTRYTFDDRNLLTALDDGTNHTEYAYDGAGRRISQTVNGVFTQFVVEPSSPIYQTIEERDAAGAMLANYTYGMDRITGVLPGDSTLTYYLPDVLSSVGGMVDPSGSSLSDYRYDAFGTVFTNSTVSTNSYWFAGEHSDNDTGLIYLRARYYDPGTGRFLGKDPLGVAEGFNGYIYGNADPINRLDPSGLDDYFIKLHEINTQVPDVIQEPGHAWVTLTANGQSTSYGFGPAEFITKADLRSGIGVPGKVSAVSGQADIWSQTHIPDYSSGPVRITESQYQAAMNFIEASYLQGNGFNSTLSNAQFSNVSLCTNFAAGVASAAGIPTYVRPGALPWEFGISARIGIAVKAVGDFTNAVGQGLSNVWNAIDDWLVPPAYGGEIVAPGGVLIDQAATLVDGNLRDITGATYDPVSHQLVFLGSASASMHDVSLDYFTTAVQAVYGSSVPPYVTLDPPAKLATSTFDLGSGAGVVPSGKTAPVVVHYTPYTWTEADDMSLTFKIDGNPVTVRLDGYPMNIYAGGRRGMWLTTLSSSGLPSGFTVTMPPKNTMSQAVFNLSAQGQDSYWTVSLVNNTGASVTITDLLLVPDLQHRKFGGRVENTELGWIMFEADRITKDLAIGLDQITSAIYDSHNPSLPSGFQNMLERYLAAGQTGQHNTRLWLTPNQETLKRYIDPVTGEATVVFDQSSVQLKTESLMTGHPEDPYARAFTDFFNSHYDEFANMEFAVHDPADPTGVNIIYVKVFDKLRDAMKAVSLARFFRDNGIPLDTWWLNSYSPPVEYSLATIPTLFNSMSNGSLTLQMWGGVQIDKPNTYVPDAVAQVVTDAVKSQRTDLPGDLDAQSWSVSSTPVGDLNAVAASFDATKQDANITLSAADLAFDMPGDLSLAFDRYYNSGYVGKTQMGQGWQAGRYEVQFQYPSWYDDYRLMKDSGGNPLAISGLYSDTRLRSGEIRLIDHATGQVINFTSSLSLSYSQDAQGNPIIATSGLGAGNVPTFAAGAYRDGTSLVQSSSSQQYTFTRPNGSTIVFDSNGVIQKITDSRGYAVSYTYDSTTGLLTQVSSLNQSGSTINVIKVTYDANGRIQYVAGPDNVTNPQRRAAYTYDSAGRLTQVDIQNYVSSAYVTARTTQYQYNASNQLSAVITPDGVTALTNTPDLRGRSDQRQSATGSLTDYSFSIETAGVRTTQIVDQGSVTGNDPTAQGVAALEYFAAGSTAQRQFDSSDRATGTTDPLGNTTQFGYSGDTRLPTSVMLPTANRPAISIERNSVNLPTVVNDPANMGAQPVQISYNAANLPTSITDEKGRVTTYTYTAWNDVATVTYASGTVLAATYTYTYNAQKLLQNITDPLSHIIAMYTYDTNGRVKTFKDGANVTTTYDYDTLGRLIKVWDPTLTGTTKYVQYNYNDNDQVTSVVAPTGTTNYAYDAVTHRLTSVTDPMGNVTQYGYNAATGKLTSVTQVAAGGNAVTSYTYDRLGNLVLLTAPEGTRTAFRYDAMGRQTNVIEDDGQLPDTGVRTQAPSSSTMHVTATASEPVLVASLKYWQDGQPPSSAVVQSARLNDLSTFSFDLTGVDSTKRYRYELTMTDRVGQTQMVSQGLLDAVAPTISAVLDSSSDTGIVGDNVTRITTPTFSGQTEDLASVTVDITGPGGYHSTESAQAGSDGRWSYTLAGEDALGDGQYVVRASAVDVGGNVSPQDALVTITVDSTPPRVQSVRLNSSDWRSVGSVDPSGLGVRTIDVTFREPVLFGSGAVTIYAVTFPDGVETIGDELTPANITGSGTNRMLVTFGAVPVVDTWIRVTLNSGAIADLASSVLDGEPNPAGSGRGYIYSAALDLPTGNGTAGGDAVFYVGSLRGDFNGDLSVGPDDLEGFATAWGAKSLDADFRGVGFGPRPPDGRITLSDIDGFTAVYQAGIALGRHLDPLPMSGGGLASEVIPLPPLTASSAGADILAETAALLPLSRRIAPIVTEPQGSCGVQGEEEPVDALPASLNKQNASGRAKSEVGMKALDTVLVVAAGRLQPAGAMSKPLGATATSDGTGTFLADLCPRPADQESNMATDMLDVLATRHLRRFRSVARPPFIIKNLKARTPAGG